MNENIENTVEVEEVKETTPVEAPTEESKKKFNIKKVLKTVAVFGTGLVAGVLLGKREDDSNGYCLDYFEPTVNNVEDTPTESTTED